MVTSNQSKSPHVQLVAPLLVPPCWCQDINLVAPKVVPCHKAPTPPGCACLCPPQVCVLALGASGT